MNAIESVVKSRGVNIHTVLRRGPKDKPSLLFVPGIMMPWWIFEKQFEYFSKSFTVAVMEPRSQGESEQSTEGHFALSMAADIKAVVDELGLKQLILVGWSIGVPQVVNYALHYNNLSGLVLIDGIVGLDSNLSFYRAMVDYWSQFQRDRIPNTKAFIKSIFKEPHPESYYERMNEVALKTPTNTVMTLINNYMLQDFRSELPSLKVPTFIATIEGPRLQYMQEMQKLIPKAEIEIFRNAEHALFVDQPDAFHRSLETFIAANTGF